MRLDRRHHRLDCFEVGEIDVERQRLDAEIAADLVADRRRRLDGDVGEHDVEAVGGQHAGRGGADGTGAAGDQGGPHRCHGIIRRCRACSP